MIDQIIKLESAQEIEKEVNFLGRFLQCFPDELKVDCKNTHHFAPGVYAREILVPKGTFIIGKLHKTEHMNIILSGKGKAICDGEVKEINAGDIFVSQAGGRKVVIAEEDLKVLNIFPTKETNLDKLENSIAVTEPEPTKEEMKLFDRLIGKGLICQ